MNYPKVAEFAQALEALSSRPSTARPGCNGVLGMYLEDCSRHSTSPGSDEQGSWVRRLGARHQPRSLTTAVGSGVGGEEVFDEPPECSDRQGDQPDGSPSKRRPSAETAATVAKTSGNAHQLGNRLRTRCVSGGKASFSSLMAYTSCGRNSTTKAVTPREKSGAHSP